MRFESGSSVNVPTRATEKQAASMERLRYYMRSTLQLNNARDMQTSLDYRVFEDRGLLTELILLRYMSMLCIG